MLQPTGSFPRNLWGEGFRMKSQPLLLSEGRSWSPQTDNPKHSPFLAETLGLWRPPQDTAVLFHLFLTVSHM